MKKYLFAAFLVVGLAALLAPPQAFAQDDKPFTVHGEVRARGEYDNNASDFDSNSNSDDGALFFPYRVRIAVEGHFTKNVVGYIEMQTTGTWGGDVSAYGLGYDPIYNPRWAGNGIAQDTGMYQGYVTLNELISKSFSLRIGRQEIVFGNEFIFGDEDFYSGISHDGIVATWNLKPLNINVWYTRPNEGSINNLTAANTPPPFQAITTPTQTIEQFGGYVTFNVHKNWGVDIYALNVNDRGMGGRWQAFGARFDHMNWDAKGLIWNFEYTMETGSLDSTTITGAATSTDVSGSAGEALIGWDFGGGKNIHRIYGKYEYASGDKFDPLTGSGDKYEGFIPLFGDVHGRTGNGDWFMVAGDSTTNLGFNSFIGGSFDHPGLMAWSVGYDGRFGEKHEIGVDYWDYQSEQDAVAIDLDTLSTFTSKDLGTAYDVWYNYNYSKNVAFQLSYSMLAPGEALTGKGSLGAGASATDDSIDRLYGQIRLRF